MHATIKTPGEHYGHLDGAAAAESGIEQCGDRAFERRRYSARLDECEREDYDRAYTEAFDTQRLLQVDWRVVESGSLP